MCLELIVKSYLNVRYGMVWTDLKDLRVPLRVGDVVILPGKFEVQLDLGSPLLTNSNWILTWSGQFWSKRSFTYVHHLVDSTPLEVRNNSANSQTHKQWSNMALRDPGRRTERPMYRRRIEERAEE
jgi:hypothetical protein